MHYLPPMQHDRSKEHAMIAKAAGAPGGGMVMAVRFPSLTRRRMNGQVR
jgi:hypothetical protein